MKKKKPKFLRTGYRQYSKLGLRRKKKQKYRKAKGGENKIRLKKRGHLRNVSIGFRGDKKTRGLVKGLKPVLIKSIDDLKKLKKDEIAIVEKLGKKKKIEIAKYAVDNNVRLFNLNAKKFLEKIEKEKTEKNVAKVESKKEEKVKEEGKNIEPKQNTEKENEPKK